MNAEEELFEAYYRQELSADEAAAFRQSLLTETGRAERYREFTLMAAGIQYYNRLQLLDKLKQADKLAASATPAAQSLPLYRRSWLLAAAVVLLLVLSAITYMILVGLVEEPPTPYAAYDKPFTELKLSRPRGAGEAYEYKVAAKEAYENTAYGESLALLNQAIKTAGEDGETLFMQGLNHLALGELATAEEKFTASLDIRFQHQQDARWYLALTYLKQNKPAEAIPLLQELAAGAGPYQQPAQELLLQLDH